MWTKHTGCKCLGRAMKNCWEVLQIQPTTDVDVIQNTRRSLIKTWHPDTASSVKEKELYNSRSAEINAACDRAMAFAKAWKPVPGWDGGGATRPNTRASSTVVGTWLYVLGKPVGAGGSWKSR